MSVRVLLPTICQAHKRKCRSAVKCAVHGYSDASIHVYLYVCIYLFIHSNKLIYVVSSRLFGDMLYMLNE